MGTRTLFQIHDGDHRNVVATFYANCSHSKQDAVAVMKQTLAEPASRLGPNALVERLMGLRYLTAEGGHLAGDRIFWLVSPEESASGDHEMIVHVHGEGATPHLLEQGRLELAPAGWVWNVRSVRR
jgi:hypothetical protein